MAQLLKPPNKQAMRTLSSCCKAKERRDSRSCSLVIVGQKSDLTNAVQDDNDSMKDAGSKRSIDVNPDRSICTFSFVYFFLAANRASPTFRGGSHELNLELAPWCLPTSTRGTVGLAEYEQRFGASTLDLNLPSMAFRGTESPMDFEWQGRGPVDPNSPFHKHLVDMQAKKRKSLSV
jgi:hypothetical protein